MQVTKVETGANPADFWSEETLERFADATFFAEELQKNGAEHRKRMEELYRGTLEISQKIAPAKLERIFGAAKRAGLFSYQFLTMPEGHAYFDTLTLACQKGDTALACVLIKSGLPICHDAFEEAIKHADVLLTIVQEGVPLNSMQIIRIIAFAIKKQHGALMQALLARNDISFVYWKRALQEVSLAGIQSAALFLIQEMEREGSKIAFPPDCDWRPSPAHRAILSGDAEKYLAHFTMKTLLMRWPLTGQTALELGAAFNQVEAVKTLISSHADRKIKIGEREISILTPCISDPVLFDIISAGGEGALDEEKGLELINIIAFYHTGKLFIDENNFPKLVKVAKKYDLVAVRNILSRWVARHPLTGSLWEYFLVVPPQPSQELIPLPSPLPFAAAAATEEALLARLDAIKLVTSANYLQICSQGWIGATKFMLGKMATSRLPSGNSLLHVACQYNQFKLAQFLVERGADLEEVDPQGLTPLYHLVSRNNGEAITWLLKKIETSPTCFRCINRIGTLRNTALSLAWEKGDEGIVTQLIDAGADPTLPPEKAALEELIKTKKWSLIPHILRGVPESQRPTFINKQNAKALSLAYAAGQRDTVELLLKAGADILLRQDGKTLLHLYGSTLFDWAIPHMVQQVPEPLRHEFVNALDPNGNAPLDLFVHSIGRIRELKRLGAEVGLRLIDAAKGNHRPVAMAYLADFKKRAVKKALIDQVDAEGKTALHYTCNRGMLSLSKTLIRGGGDIEHTDHLRRWTALHSTVRGNSSSILAFILNRIKPIAKKAFVNLQTNEGKTALHLLCSLEAEMAEQVKMAELLIEAGSDLSLEDVKGEVPFITALRCQQIHLLPVMYRQLSDEKKQRFTEFMTKLFGNI